MRRGGRGAGPFRSGAFVRVQELGDFVGDLFSVVVEGEEVVGAVEDCESFDRGAEVVGEPACTQGFDDGVAAALEDEGWGGDGWDGGFDEVDQLEGALRGSHAEGAVALDLFGPCAHGGVAHGGIAAGEVRDEFAEQADVAARGDWDAPGVADGDERGEERELCDGVLVGEAQGEGSAGGESDHGDGAVGRMQFEECGFDGVVPILPSRRRHDGPGGLVAGEGDEPGGESLGAKGFDERFELPGAAAQAVDGQAGGGGGWFGWV